MNGVHPQLTQAVVSIESSGNPFAVGAVKEVGLMQIRPEFSRFSRKQLLNSCTNVMAGTEILGKLKRDCKLCIDKIYVNGYNLGVTKARKLKHPRLWKYHKKVLAKLEEK
jgi:soluble lytic murein transglycosylase-like protein